MLRVLPAILAAQGQRQEAETRPLESMARARKVGALSWRLRSAIDLPTHWHHGEKEAAGIAMLQAVFAQFTQRFGTRGLRTAASLLETPAAPVRTGWRDQRPATSAAMAGSYAPSICTNSMRHRWPERFDQAWLVPRCTTTLPGRSTTSESSSTSTSSPSIRMP
jgi:hypothetical protein